LSGCGTQAHARPQYDDYSFHCPYRFFVLRHKGSQTVHHFREKVTEAAKDADEAEKKMMKSKTRFVETSPFVRVF
jgi:hypothetical protein